MVKSWSSESLTLTICPTVINQVIGGHVNSSGLQPTGFLYHICLLTHLCTFGHFPLFIPKCIVKNAASGCWQAGMQGRRAGWFPGGRVPKLHCAFCAFSWQGPLMWPR